MLTEKRLPGMVYPGEQQRMSTDWGYVHRGEITRVLERGEHMRICPVLLIEIPSCWLLDTKTCQVPTVILGYGRSNLSVILLQYTYAAFGIYSNRAPCQPRIRRSTMRWRSAHLDSLLPIADLCLYVVCQGRSSIVNTLHLSFGYSAEAGYA